MNPRTVKIKRNPDLFDHHDIWVDGHKAASFWFLRDVRQVSSYRVVKCAGNLTHVNGKEERLDKFVSFADVCQDLRYRFSQGTAP